MSGLKKYWRKLSGRRRKEKIQALRARELIARPKMTPLGFKLGGHPAMAAGDFEPSETRIIGQLLKHSEVFVNIGANIGYYCCLALQAGKPTFAFEPIADNVEHLLSNVRVNGWDGFIEIYPIALTDRVGVIDIYGKSTWASVLKGWAGTSEEQAKPVPTNRLDNVLAERLTGKRSLIVVDIEGAEYLMLAGAERILVQTPSPVWVVEISIDEHQPDDVTINPKLRETFDRFWACGYRAFEASETLHPVEAADIDRIVATGENHLATHNFIFGKSRAIDGLM